MKIILNLLVAIFSCLSLYSQPKKAAKKRILPVVDLSYQHSLFADMRLLRSSLEDIPHTGYLLSGPYVGVETNFTSSHYVVGPKIGYEVNVSYLVARVSLVNYFSNTERDLKLVPEMGISYGQFISLSYGYNFSLAASKIPETGKNRISLGFIISRKLWSLK